MNFKEAQDFAARFAAGEYVPEEHAAFLRWLKEATIEELTIIADTYELKYGFEAVGIYGNRIVMDEPSAEWVMELEKKLDVSREEKDETGEEDETTVMGVRETGVRWFSWSAWITAASVAAVSAGGYLYVHQTSVKPIDAMAREKLLSMTFSVPRGEFQRKLILEDGSKVWLNAGSSLKYPAHFPESERVVQLSGEAFFDVDGSAKRPFKVLIRDAEVDVLGTYFAIMAYDDEPMSRTTLVDGTLKIVNGQRGVELKTGEQAELVYGSAGVGDEITIQPGISPTFMPDWKGGIYRFHQTELHAVTRELERIFNVTVQYQPNVGNPQIDGILDLNKGLDIVLKQLESVSNIRFKHAGKIVIASSI